MIRYIAQSREQLAQEIEFWRDFIRWWEQKNGHPAGERMLAALAAAECRYHKAGLALVSEQGSSQASIKPTPINTG